MVKSALWPLLGAIAFILLWYLGAAVAGADLILPKPEKAAAAFFELIGGGSFWAAALGTLKRTLISFVLSFLLALILAAASAFSRRVKGFLSPWIVILRAMPTIAVILLSLIWLKSDVAPMFIAFLIIFPNMYTAFFSAIDSVDSDLVEMSRLYRVSRRDVALRLYLPSILPAVFSSARSNISLCLKIMIASEVLAQTRRSMGIEMQLSRIYLDTPQLLAWTAAAVLLGFLLELAVEGIRKAVVKWKA